MSCLVTLKKTKTKPYIRNSKNEITMATHDDSRCRRDTPCITFENVSNFKETLDVLLVETIHHALNMRICKHIDDDFEKWHRKLDRKNYLNTAHLLKYGKLKKK